MKKKPAAAGRPRKKFNRRDFPISLKLTAEERDRFTKAADASRMTLSEFLREHARHAADRILGPES